MRFKSARFQADDVRFIVLYKIRLDTNDYYQLVTNVIKDYVIAKTI
jgi:hypothetical protein